MVAITQGIGAIFEVFDGARTALRLNDLLELATQEVWLVSPYHTLPKLKPLCFMIHEALKRGVKVALVVRDEQRQTSSALAQSSDLRRAGLKLFAVPGLHAKIYWSESHVLASSMNLTKSSPLMSKDFGIFAGLGDLHSQFKGYLSANIFPHLRLLGGLAPARVAPRKQAAPALLPNAVKAGFCIHCRSSVELNRWKPYCRPDWDVWRDAGRDREHREKYCHTCGSEYVSSVSKPECHSCRPTLPDKAP